MAQLPQLTGPSSADGDEVVAASVRRYREATGKSQEWLADAMSQLGHKFHQSTVFKIETGDRKVSAGELVSLAQIFGVTVDGMYVTSGHGSLAVTYAMRETGDRVALIAGNVARLARDGLVAQGNLADRIKDLEDMYEREGLAQREGREHDWEVIQRGVANWRLIAKWPGFRDYYNLYHDESFNEIVKRGKDDG